MKSFKFIALIYSQVNLLDAALINGQATKRTLPLPGVDILRHAPVAEGVAAGKHGIFVVSLAQGAPQLILCFLHLKSIKFFI